MKISQFLSRFKVIVLYQADFSTILSKLLPDTDSASRLTVVTKILSVCKQHVVKILAFCVDSKGRTAVSVTDPITRDTMNRFFVSSVSSLIFRWWKGTHSNIDILLFFYPSSFLSWKKKNKFLYLVCNFSSINRRHMLLLLLRKVWLTFFSSSFAGLFFFVEHTSSLPVQYCTNRPAP